MRTIASFACVVAALGIVAAGQARAEVYACQVRQSWSLNDSGDLELYGSKIYVGDRFTVDGEAGEVKGEEDLSIWKGPWKVAETGGNNQTLILMSYYVLDTRPVHILSVMTWTDRPEMSFSHYHLGTGTILTGLCRVR